MRLTRRTETDGRLGLARLQLAVPTHTGHRECRTALAPAAVPQIIHRALNRHADIPGHRRARIVIDEQVCAVTAAPIVADFNARRDTAVSAAGAGGRL